MATLLAVINRQSRIHRNRYGGDVWIAWANELLEELSGSGFLMPSLKKESGCIVEDDVWITPPDGLRNIINITHPANLNKQYLFKELEEKIRLTNVNVEEQDSPDSADSFQNYAVGSMDIDIDDAAEDDFKNYLLVVDGGTFLGKTYIIKGNDAAAGGYTTVYFRHILSTALDNTKVTSCYLVHTDYYVLLEYGGSYTDIAATSDEVPIKDEYEKRITKAFLNWKVRERAVVYGPDTVKAEDNYNKVISKLKNELRSGIGSLIKPRVSPGYSQYTGSINSEDKEWANPRNP